MTDQDKTIPGQSSGYYLCDLARTNQDFSIIDVESGQISGLKTERELRAEVDLKYPGARLLLTTGKSADPGGALGSFVIIAAARPTDRPGQWRSVAYVGGAVHGPSCVPFSPTLWQDVVDLAGVSTSIAARHATLQAANASWRPLEAPHPYRDKPDGVEWPVGPRGETCADCGTDPRNQIHRT